MFIKTFLKENYFVHEHQIIKTFKNCQFHDRTIDGAKHFVEREITKHQGKLQIISIVIRTHNHLVRKGTPNYLAKLAYF